MFAVPEKMYLKRKWLLNVKYNFICTGCPIEKDFKKKCQLEHFLGVASLMPVCWLMPFSKMPLFVYEKECCEPIIMDSLHHILH